MPPLLAKFNFIQFPSTFLTPWALNSKTHDDDDDELDGRALIKTLTGRARQLSGLPDSMAPEGA